LERNGLGGPPVSGLHGLGYKIRRFDGLTGSPGKSQKEGQEDHGGIKELGGTPPRAFKVPWSSWPSFRLFPGLPENPPHWLVLHSAFKGLIRLSGAL